MSIGAELAAARRQAGLTITEVSQRTRIREAIVQGIERDDFSACGGDFYARGHIRAIARVAGVDPEPLVREYDEARDAATQETTMPISRAGRTTPVVAATSKRAPDGSAAPDKVAAAGNADGTGPEKTALPRTPVPAVESGVAADGRAAGSSGRTGTVPGKLVIPAPGSGRGSGRPVPELLPPPSGGLRLPLWGTALVAVLATTAGVLIYHGVTSHPSSHLTGSPAVAASRPATPKATTPPPTPTPTPTATPTPTVNPNTVVISLVAVNQPCWAQITTAAGNTVYQGIVATGTTMTWTEGQAVTLQLGNPSAVTLTVNGQARTGLGVNPVTLNLAPGSQ